ncbi:hypothetical protein HAX54_049426 [Datura stramonium]|uniref:Uncharacterized protein n=1 Tax=Datura stramonium TaxID=4076 RepID=A0ABS8SWT0_DATST|nr:hypothetical protein [Datura stramonium]
MIFLSVDKLIERNATPIPLKFIAIDTTSRSILLGKEDLVQIQLNRKCTWYRDAAPITVKLTTITTVAHCPSKANGAPGPGCLAKCLAGYAGRETRRVSLIEYHSKRSKIVDVVALNVTVIR